MEPSLIPADINVFYPGWFPLDLLCLHSSVLCKIPVTSIVPCEYVTQLPYCPLHKKSDARVVKLHSDSTRTLLCVCLFVAHPRFAHPRRETPFHADTGTQKVCGNNIAKLQLWSSNKVICWWGSPQCEELHQRVAALRTTALRWRCCFCITLFTPRVYCLQMHNKIMDLESQARGCKEAQSKQRPLVSTMLGSQELSDSSLGEQAIC